MIHSRSRLRRGSVAAFAGLAISAGSFALVASTASATDVTAQTTVAIGTITSVDVTPWPAANNTATVTVTVTGARYGAGANSGQLINSNNAVAVSLCGNFKTDGVTPLTSAEQSDPANCDGASDILEVLPFVNVSNGNFTRAKTLRPSGIGDNDTKCLTGGTNACRIGIGDSASGTIFGMSIPVLGGPAPATTTLTPGSTVGRGGNAITFTGTAYDVSVATGTANLCDTDGTSNCSPLTGVAISTTAAGALTGSGSLPAAATSGAHALVVATATKSASASFTILGTPAISLTPSSGGPGTVVTVNGSNFDPGITVGVSDTDGVGAIGSPSVVPVGPAGTFSTTVTAVAGTVAIGAANVTGTDPVNFATAPYSLSANECTAVAAGGTTGTCSLTQSITQVVNGGSLKMSEAGAQITMGPVDLAGTAVTGHGVLNEVTVTDARGTLTGWAVTGSVTDLTTGAGANANHTIPKSAISWTPACLATAGATQAEVAAGAAGVLADGSALCTAASGGGGGVFTGNAGIDVVVAPTKAAGTYGGTLTLTLTGS